jgi:hypothetical protein
VPCIAALSKSGALYPLVWDENDLLEAPLRAVYGHTFRSVAHRQRMKRLAEPTENPKAMSTRSKETQFTRQEALQFHRDGRPGKLEIAPTKPMSTQRDLSLAYSPGVAVPVQAIAEKPELAYDYTTKGNLVAVISNGTAILGLGNLGALASKPVMEGKAVLFKRFADIDSIDLEIDTEDVDTFINAVRYLGPSFGGINLKISARRTASLSSSSFASSWTSPCSMMTSTARRSSPSRASSMRFTSQGANCGTSSWWSTARARLASHAWNSLRQWACRTTRLSCATRRV